jgi:hypothetical protein
MTYAPRVQSTKLRNDVTTAIDLYEYKLDKKYPFRTATGYDWDEITEYRVYSKLVQEDNKPIVRGITHDMAYFYLHSSYVLLNTQCYTFIHLEQKYGNIRFRGLCFTDFVDAYRYANAYGCTVVKSSEVELNYIDYITHKLDGIDVFVDVNIQIADRQLKNSRR